MYRSILFTTGFFTTVLAVAAATIPYGSVGSVAPEFPITATATGPIMGYFVQGGVASQGGAWNTDFVRLYDVTAGTVSPFIFDNQTTKSGAAASFGNVTVGDKLVFELFNQTHNFTYATDAAYSHDLVNHGYVTPFAGGVLDVTTKTGAFATAITLPAGVYVGFEDLEKATFTDNNYNDDSFVFTDLAAGAVTPIVPITPNVAEPGSLMLVGSALLASAGCLRRKFRRK